METYLPDEDFAKCASILGHRELNRSVQSALVICDAIHETIEEERVVQIKRHPLVQMWGRHTPILIQYALVLNEHRLSTAISSRTLRLAYEEIDEKLAEHLSWATSGEYTMDPPRWLGEYSFHMSQRALLMRTSPTDYGHLWPEVDMVTTQYWPVA